MLRQRAQETRDRAAAARVESRELAVDRAELMAALERGWREQSSLLGEMRESREQLHVAVRAFAAQLRRQQLPPERMLVQVKDLVRTAAPRPGPEAQELMDQVVRWSIEAYYEGAIA